MLLHIFICANRTPLMRQVLQVVCIDQAVSSSIVNSAASYRTTAARHAQPGSALKSHSSPKAEEPGTQTRMAVCMAAVYMQEEIQGHSHDCHWVQH
ncbi:TPA: hypothetical protein ACH3X2_009584 [Trebouxia sp. C0005]